MESTVYLLKAFRYRRKEIVTQTQIDYVALIFDKFGWIFFAEETRLVMLVYSVFAFHFYFHFAVGNMAHPVTRLRFDPCICRELIPSEAPSAFFGWGLLKYFLI